MRYRCTESRSVTGAQVFMHWIFSQIDQKMAPELFTIRPKIWPDALKSHNHDDTAYDTAANVPRKSLLKNQKSKTFRPQYLVPIAHKILHSY